jgi:protocatechuate 3,4-dioxygenase beta subunit
MSDHDDIESITPTEPGALTRRSSLLRLGGLAGALVGGSAWALDDAGDAEAGPAAVAAGLVTCVLTPEMTEGPYYLPGDKVRKDMREGKPGAPLTVRATVLDVKTCKPIRGAAVDLWHCDAAGTYSGFAREGTEGETFLRGIQRTNAKGVAVLKTIYPGWYPGRTVHIHVQVHVGGNVVHTGQLFFSDKLTDTVYKRAPYNRRPGRTTRNANDSIFVNGGSRSIMKVARSGAGYVGTVTMGVQRG